MVCTTRTGLADLVEEVWPGTVVPPEDPRALAKALLPFLRDPSTAAAAGQRGRERVTRLADEAVDARLASYRACLEVANARGRWHRRPR